MKIKILFFIEITSMWIEVYEKSDIPPDATHLILTEYCDKDLYLPDTLTHIKFENNFEQFNKYDFKFPLSVIYVDLGTFNGKINKFSLPKNTKELIIGNNSNVDFYYFPWYSLKKIIIEDDCKINFINIDEFIELNYIYIGKNCNFNLNSYSSKIIFIKDIHVDKNYKYLNELLENKNDDRIEYENIFIF